MKDQCRKFRMMGVMLLGGLVGLMGLSAAQAYQALFDAKCKTLKLDQAQQSESGLLFYLEDVSEGKVHTCANWVDETNGNPPLNDPDLPSLVLHVCEKDGTDLYTLPISARYGTAYNNGRFLGESYVVVTCLGRSGPTQTAVFGFKNGVRHVFAMWDRKLQYSLSPDESQILVAYQNFHFDSLFVSGSHILPRYTAGIGDHSTTAQEYHAHRDETLAFLKENPEWDLSYGVRDSSRWSSDQRFILIYAESRVTSLDKTSLPQDRYILIDLESAEEGQRPEAYAEKIQVPNAAFELMGKPDHDVQISVVDRELHFWRGDIADEKDPKVVDRLAPGYLGTVSLNALSR